ncbi:hypothetical protein [Anaeromyxobacter terrae]|uniref:hypothetical protein n=1 Tax=Anaeromyxobacter terrae TaxID=2925406 RepID=UPI001F57A990|nr:hypothetical protein [Anaeromyxobacter sp. SG22]
MEATYAFLAKERYGLVPDPDAGTPSRTTPTTLPALSSLPEPLGTAALWTGAFAKDIAMLAAAERPGVGAPERVRLERRTAPRREQRRPRTRDHRVSRFDAAAGRRPGANRRLLGFGRAAHREGARAIRRKGSLHFP